MNSAIFWFPETILSKLKKKIEKFFQNLRIFQQASNVFIADSL
jgi:hypothetical protein